MPESSRHLLPQAGPLLRALASLAPVEMLAFLHDLAAKGVTGRAELAQALVIHFLGNAPQHLSCPWTLGSACAI